MSLQNDSRSYKELIVENDQKLCLVLVLTLKLNVGEGKDIKTSLCDLEKTFKQKRLNIIYSAQSSGTEAALQVLKFSDKEKAKLAFDTVVGIVLNPVVKIDIFLVHESEYGTNKSCLLSEEDIVLLQTLSKSKNIFKINIPFNCEETDTSETQVVFESFEDLNLFVYIKTGSFWGKFKTRSSEVRHVLIIDDEESFSLVLDNMDQAAVEKLGIKDVAGKMGIDFIDLKYFGKQLRICFDNKMSLIKFFTSEFSRNLRRCRICHLNMAKIQNKSETFVYDRIENKDSSFFSIKKPCEIFAAGCDPLNLSYVTGKLIVLSRDQIETMDVCLKFLKNCTVEIHGSPSFLEISNVTNSTILAGPISTSVVINTCYNSTVSIACKQFRICGSVNTTLYLHTNTKPILEDCEDIKVANYNFIYPGLKEDYLKAEIDQSENHWSNIETLNWLSEDNKSWSILSLEDSRKAIGLFSPFNIGAATQGHLYDCWFLAAVMAVVDKSNIEKMIEIEDCQEDELKVHLFEHGNKRTVILDTALPCDKFGNFMFCRYLKVMLKIETFESLNYEILRKAEPQPLGWVSSKKNLV